MAKFVTNHSGKRNLGNKKNGVNVGGAKNFLSLPNFVEDQPTLQPVYDKDGNILYSTREENTDTPDKTLFQILSENADSPVITQDVTRNTFDNTVETTPQTTTPSDGGGASGNAKKPKIIYQSEDCALWRDSQGRLHVVYSEMHTKKVEGPKFFARFQVASGLSKEINREIEVDDVNASITNPVRILMYNRTEDDPGQLIKFDKDRALPLVYIHSRISSKKFKGKMVTHALLPEKVTWERNEEVDIAFWQNVFCDCVGEQSIEAEPVTTGVTGEGPENFVDDNLGTEPTPTGSDDIQINNSDDVFDKTMTVSERDNNDHITSEAQQPSSSCADAKPGEPYKPISDCGHPAYDRTERHRLCKRRLMHMRGQETRIISGLNWGSIYLFTEPYTIAEFDDGPLSNIEPELRVSEAQDAAHTNASTRIFGDDCAEADLDDLSTVQQPEFYTNGQSTDPYRWMMRMQCAPDPRGGLLHDPKAVRTGMLRDPLTINVPGHLEIKTGAFFRVLGPVSCNHDSHTTTGPIDFRLQEAEFGCFPCGQTKQPASEESPPTSPGGVSTERIESDGTNYVGDSRNNGHGGSIYTSLGGIQSQSSSVSETGSVSFSPDTPFTVREWLREKFRLHNVRLDLSGLNLQLFQKDGSSVRISTADELITQIQNVLPIAKTQGLNSTIGSF